MVSGVAAIAGIYGGKRRRFRIAMLPTLAIALMTVAAYVVRDWLPDLIEPEGLAALLQEHIDVPFLPGVTGLALALVVVIVASLVAGVVLYRLTWARGGPCQRCLHGHGIGHLRGRRSAVRTVAQRLLRPRDQLGPDAIGGVRGAPRRGVR